MKVRVKVPASTANLGPGFDCLGLALKLYNTGDAEETAGGLEIQIAGEGEKSLPRGKSNLVYKMIALAFARSGKKLRGLKICQTNEIPTARGLGSSSAAVIAGLVAGDMLAKARMTDRDILDASVESEGHPDNVVPALLGGLAISSMEGKKVQCVIVSPPAGLKVLVAVPDFELSTKKARTALPKSYLKTDAVFNINKTAFLVSALFLGNYSMLGSAMQDRIHQPYREKLVPGLREALQIKEKNTGIALSGSGPSIVVLSDRRLPEVKSRLKDIFNKRGHAVRLLELEPDSNGVQKKFIS